MLKTFIQQKPYELNKKGVYMKKTIVRVLSLFGCFAGFGILQLAAEEVKPDFTALLKKADAMLTFSDSDFNAKYTFVHNIPGSPRDTVETKGAWVFRRDKDNVYSLTMEYPEKDKGKKYLKQNNNLWLYDPGSQTNSNDKPRFVMVDDRERFQNSSVRNSDLNHSNLAGNYRVVDGKRTKLGERECWLLNLEAKTNDVTFPRMNLWITDDAFIQKTEEFSLSGKSPVRATAVPDGYQIVGTHYIQKRMVVIDYLKGMTLNGKQRYESTIITITSPDLRDLPNTRFNKYELEKGQ